MLAERAARREFVVGGASAGGMCWFDAGYTMSFGPLMPLHDGLGWFPGSFCPHAQQPGRLDAYGQLERVIATSDTARVYDVDRMGAHEHAAERV